MFNFEPGLYRIRDLNGNGDNDDDIEAHHYTSLFELNNAVSEYINDLVEYDGNEVSDLDVIVEKVEYFRVNIMTRVSVDMIEII